MILNEQIIKVDLILIIILIKDICRIVSNVNLYHILQMLIQVCVIKDHLLRHQCYYNRIMLNIYNHYRVKSKIFVHVCSYTESAIKINYLKNVQFIIISSHCTVKINLNYFVLIVFMEVLYIKIIELFLVKIQLLIYPGTIKII